MLAKKLKEILADVPDNAVVVGSDLGWRDVNTLGCQYLKDRNTLYIDIDTLFDLARTNKEEELI